MVPGLVLASTNQREYCIQVQPCLTVARRPNACLGHRDGINVPGHARSTRLLPKEVLPSVPDVFCPYRACFASPVGLEDVACYARRSQPSRLGRKTVLLRRGQRTAEGKHQESAIRTLHQGFQNTQSCLYDVLYCHGQKGRQSSSGALPMSAPHPRRSLDSSYRGPRDLSMYSRIRL